MLQTQHELKQRGHTLRFWQSDDRKKMGTRKETKTKALQNTPPTVQPINQPANPIGDKPSGGCKHKRKKEGNKKEPGFIPVTMTNNPSQWICILKLGNAALLIFFTFQKPTSRSQLSNSTFKSQE